MRPLEIVWRRSANFDWLTGSGLQYSCTGSGITGGTSGVAADDVAFLNFLLGPESDLTGMHLNNWSSDLWRKMHVDLYLWLWSTLKWAIWSKATISRFHFTIYCYTSLWTSRLKWVWVNILAVETLIRIVDQDNNFACLPKSNLKPVFRNCSNTPMSWRE